MATHHNLHPISVVSAPGTSAVVSGNNGQPLTAHSNYIIDYSPPDSNASTLKQKLKSINNNYAATANLINPNISSYHMATYTSSPPSNSNDSGFDSTSSPNSFLNNNNNNNSSNAGIVGNNISGSAHFNSNFANMSISGSPFISSRDQYISISKLNYLIELT
jgi:hypothetical protein